MPPSIYDYIKREEAQFESDEIQVGENWYWNFKKHVQLIFHLMHGVFYTGENNFLRAFKQVMRPLMELSIWTEDLEVKDVVFYIEGQANRALSFLIKKYHDEVYVKEHDLDTLFDEITESDIAYGGALVQKGVKRPEIIPLQSIAFCDQTDILGGPVAFKHFFSPEKLKSMAKYGWGSEKNGATMSLDDLAVLASDKKAAPGDVSDRKNEVTGRVIEVYVLRGNFPISYLDDSDDMEDYFNQLHVVALYVDSDNQKQSATLYRKKESEGNLKLLVSKRIYGRALGYSDGESLVHPQVWTNFATIHKMGLLEAGSKVPLYTDDPTYTTKNKIQDMENLEITTIEDGKSIQQVPTSAPGNIQLLQNAVDDFFESGQFNVGAFNSLMGKEESSGTTFRGQERLVAQGRGPHDRRMGQRAKFIEEIYRDWIIPDIVKEILKGKKFMSTLSSEELMWVAERLSISEGNKKIVDKMLSLKAGDVTPEKIQAIQEIPNIIKRDVIKGGSKQLLEVLKDEFRDVEIKIGINIANKQKALGTMSDKLLSIIETAMANPQGFVQAMQIPAIARSFENVLEYSNVPITDFQALISAPPVMAGASGVADPQLEGVSDTANVE